MTSTMNQEDFKADIQEALATLRKGGIILYPTDTIWGIGADATNPEAVARIYALKRREDSKSMLALVESVDALYRWVKCVPETALQLVDVAVDPLTINLRLSARDCTEYAGPRRVAGYPRHFGTLLARTVPTSGEARCVDFG